MSKTLQWILGIGVLVVVAAVAFSTVTSFLLPNRGWGGGYGWMGPGMMYGGGGMMGGLGMPLFGIGMLLWPLLVIGLVVVGIVALVRGFGGPGSATPTPAATTPCRNCGRPVQAGWVACPYCGEKV